MALASIGDTKGQFAIRAIKKAEDSDEIVVRHPGALRAGRPAHAHDGIADPASARDQRRRRGRCTITLPGSGALPADVQTLSAADGRADRRRQTVCADNDHEHTAAAGVSTSTAFSTDKNPADGDFDGSTTRCPGDLLPRELLVDGVRFALGSSAAGAC